MKERKQPQFRSKKLEETEIRIKVQPGEYVSQEKNESMWICYNQAYPFNQINKQQK